MTGQKQEVLSGSQGSCYSDAGGRSEFTQDT